MPTPFHRLMDKLAHEHRLLHHITQNFDRVEQTITGPRSQDSTSPWSAWSDEVPEMQSSPSTRA
jgi:NAD-dependent SIR2 family protein deacetylase